MTEPYNGGYLKVDLIGPFEYHAVVVNGRRVPFLTARPANGGKVWVSIEGFATIDLPVSDYERLIHFMADCIAVGMGYTGHPSANREPVMRPPFPRMIELGAPRVDDVSGDNVVG